MKSVLIVLLAAVAFCHALNVQLREMPRQPIASIGGDISIELDVPAYTSAVHVLRILWCATAELEDAAPEVHTTSDGLPVCKGAHMMHKQLYPSTNAEVASKVRMYPRDRLIMVDPSIIGGRDAKHRAVLVVAYKVGNDVTVQCTRLDDRKDGKTNVATADKPVQHDKLPVLPKAPTAQATPWYVATGFGLLAFACFCIVAYVVQRNQQEPGKKEGPNLDNILVHLAKPGTGLALQKSE